MAGAFVTVSVFPSMIEAQLAKGKLQSEGIEARIADEHMLAIQPWYSQALGGFKLQVSEEELLAARRILERDEREENG